MILQGTAPTLPRKGPPRRLKGSCRICCGNTYLDSCWAGAAGGRGRRVRLCCCQLQEQPRQQSLHLLQEYAECQEWWLLEWLRHHLDKPGTALGTTMPNGSVLSPDIFHTYHLLFHEQFRDYQDYIVADCMLGITLFTYKILENNCLRLNLIVTCWQFSISGSCSKLGIREL